MQEKHKIEIDGYECHHCGYKWVPRKKGEYPKVCARCHVTSWDKEKKRMRA